METSHAIRGLAAAGIELREAQKVQVLGGGGKVLFETDLRQAGEFMRATA